MQNYQKVLEIASSLTLNCMGFENWRGMWGGGHLKFGGEVNFETLIYYFMSILPVKMKLIKTIVFIVFFSYFAQSLLKKFSLVT